MYLLKTLTNVFFFRRFDRGSFAPALELRVEVSRPGTYLNIINMHGLGLAKIYEKINKKEPGVGRNREK